VATRDPPRNRINQTLQIFYQSGIDNRRSLSPSTLSSNMIGSQCLWQFEFPYPFCDSIAVNTRGPRNHRDTPATVSESLGRSPYSFASFRHYRDKLHVFLCYGLFICHVLRIGRSGVFAEVISLQTLRFWAGNTYRDNSFGRDLRVTDLSYKFLLVPEQKTGSIRIESNYNPCKYFVSIPSEDIPGHRYIGQADPVLDGILPGNYRFRVFPQKPKVMPMVAVGDAFVKTNVASGKQTKLTVNYVPETSVKSISPFLECSGGSVIATDFPFYRMSPSFKRDIRIPEWELEISQTKRKPPDYRHYVDRAGCVQLRNGELFSYWSLRQDLWYSIRLCRKTR